ncbi:hypothetical protein F4Z98_10610 [Candidatus Poribacteria bacterium]|nr:hypothetical protein [Candidatus Poribacteria bacterium]
MIVVIIAGGILYLKHLEVQRQREIAETASRVKSLTPTQMATQTASGIEVVETETGGGHFHADGTWHAEPHEPVIAEEIPFEDGSFEEIVDPDLADFTDAELATYERVKLTQIKLHWAKYPDCQDYEAVWEDAARYSKWYIETYSKWNEEVDELHTEWERIRHEKNEFSGISYQILMDMPESERNAFIDNLTPEEAASMFIEVKEWTKRRMAAFNKYDEFYQQEPTEPKPQHTH